MWKAGWELEVEYVLLLRGGRVPIGSEKGCVGLERVVYLCSSFYGFLDEDLTESQVMAHRCRGT